MKGADMAQSNNSGFGPLDVIFILLMAFLLFGVSLSIAL
jgi:hypothetical protein